MSVVQLRRVDPDRNMARFYTMALQPTLFGEWLFVWEFGRIGSPGRVMTKAFPSMDEAAAALSRRWRDKVRGGYLSDARPPDLG